MKKKEKVVLIDAITNYLQLKELTASQEAQMDSFREIIVTVAKANPMDFKDGELALEGVGLLKFVNNPAKVVFVDSKETLTDIEIQGLVTDLGTAYEKKALNMTRLRTAINAKDLPILEVLKKHNVELVQGKRLDIKKQG